MKFLMILITLLLSMNSFAWDMSDQDYRAIWGEYWEKGTLNLLLQHLDNGMNPSSRAYAYDDKGKLLGSSPLLFGVVRGLDSIYEIEQLNDKERLQNESRLKAFYKLIEKGANVNDYDTDTFSPAAPSVLMQAAENVRPDIVKILLEKGANPKYSYSFGASTYTPMYFAIKSFCEECLLLLENKGVSILDDNCEAYHKFYWRNGKCGEDIWLKTIREFVERSAPEIFLKCGDDKTNPCK